MRKPNGLNIAEVLKCKWSWGAGLAGLCREACGDDGVERDVTSIMLLPPYALRFCVVGVCRDEMGPDCAPEAVIEEGDSRKWDIRRIMEWDITVTQPESYGLIELSKKSCRLLTAFVNFRFWNDWRSTPPLTFRGHSVHYSNKGNVWHLIFSFWI